MAGTSSFGMSGVNAHALFTAAAPPAARQTVQLPLHRTRHWALPRPHQLLGRAARPVGGKIAFACSLCRSQLSYMWHHQVDCCSTDIARTRDNTLWTSGTTCCKALRATIRSAGAVSDLVLSQDFHSCTCCMSHDR